MNKSFVSAIAAAVLVVGSIVNAFAVVKYQIHGLGLPADTLDSVCYSINNKGEVVGYYLGRDQQQHPFKWTLDSGVETLPYIPGGYAGVAYDVNESGQVVGSSMDGTNRNHAIIWNPDGTMVDLGAFTPNHTAAYAINDGGEVVGRRTDYYTSAYLWSSGATATEIDTLEGVMASGAHDINNDEQVVGEYYTYGNVGGNPYIWTKKDGMVGIETPGFNWGAAIAVNDSGQVVGNMYNGELQCHSFLWSQSDGLTDLGTLDGRSILVSDINNNGQIVGGGDSAFLWQDGTLYNLNDLLLDNDMVGLYKASGINDSGWIIGYGYFNGNTQTFILTPVPEPSSIFALASGAMCLGGLFLRKRK